jgi:hypothetical protein
MKRTDTAEALKQLKEIEQIMMDYSEELLADKAVLDNVLYLLGRWNKTGEDLSDEELSVLHGFLKQKLDEFIKTKAN